jgi:aminoacyl tRNA synthase complex-interacting multifunctional protein 1
VAHYPAVARWYDHIAATAARAGGGDSPLLPRAALERPPLRHPEPAAAAAPAAAKQGGAGKEDGKKGGKKGAAPASVPAPAAAAAAAAPSAAAAPAAEPTADAPAGDKKKKEKKAKAPAPPPPPARPLDDVAALDLRVGRILTAIKHPDADSLYVETIDLGDADGPRTVVSGLAKFVPLDAMAGRAVVCVCNLKPAAMRGVTSAAMVLCASAGGAVVPVAPPAGAAPGARVAAAGHPGEPEPQLNPRKKQFEAVAAHLATDGAGACVFKGAPLEVAGVGPVTCAEVPNGAIK